MRRVHQPARPSTVGLGSQVEIDRCLTATTCTPSPSSSPQGDHEYKYMIGGWDVSEQLDEVEDAECTLTTDGFTNRLLVITSEEALDLETVCYESCDACAPVNSLNETEGFSFRVFPSVTDGIVTVAFPAPLADVAQIEVRDMSGRLVHNTNAGAGTHAVVPRLEQ